MKNEVQVTVGRYAPTLSPTRALIVLLTLAVFEPFEIYAQQAGSFEQLQLLVKPGDRVSVIDTSGQSTKGSIAELSKSTMRLLVNGATRTFSEPEILEIKRRGDSLSNGAKNGALVGAGTATLGVLAVLSQNRGARAVALSGLVVGTHVAIGTGIGVGIDAMIRRDHTIFRPGSGGTSTKLVVRPLMSDGRIGVAVSFSFQGKILWQRPNF